jgi:hypothetical protein
VFLVSAVTIYQIESKIVIFPQEIEISIFAFQSDDFSSNQICMFSYRKSPPWKGLKAALMDWQQIESYSHRLVGKLQQLNRQKLIKFNSHSTWIYWPLVTYSDIIKKIPHDPIDILLCKKTRLNRKLWFLVKIEPKSNRESNF